MNGIRISVCAAVAALATFDACAAEPEWYVSSGAEYSTGKYGGTASIDETYVPVTISVSGSRLGFAVTVPWLSVTAPAGTVVVGPDGQPVVGVGANVTSSGLGDVLASITVYDVIASADGDVGLDATAKVKFGTADEDAGLGTGQNDYFVQLDAFRRFDRVRLLGTAGYAVRGDSSFIDVDDGWFAALGMSFDTSPSTRLGVFYDYRQSALQGADSVREVSASLSFRFAQGWSMRSYALAGFGDGSPEWGAGLTLGVSF